MAGFEVAKVLPAIVRLFFQVKTLPIRRGFAFPLNDVNPMNDADAMRQLAQKLQIKKHPGFNDDIWLIKCSKVREIVEKRMGDQSLLWKMMQKMAGILLSGAGGDPSGQDIAEAIMKDVRENVLRHDTPRVRRSGRFLHRPSRGHG